MTPTDTEMNRQFRTALINAGRASGAFIDDTVSDNFLLLVPGEVQGRIEAQAARIAGLEGALERRDALLREALPHVEAIEMEGDLDIRDLLLRIDAALRGQA